PLLHGPAERQVAVHGVVGGGLVGDGVRAHAAADQFGQHFGGVAEQRDRLGLAGLGVLPDPGQGVVEAVGLLVDVAGAQAHVDAALLAFAVQAAGAGQAGGPRLAAAQAARAAGQAPLAGGVAAVALAAHLADGLVGALPDAPAAEVAPRACRHLAVHHPALGIELVEVLPGGPV